MSAIYQNVIMSKLDSILSFTITKISYLLFLAKNKTFSTLTMKQILLFTINHTLTSFLELLFSIPLIVFPNLTSIPPLILLKKNSITLFPKIMSYFKTNTFHFTITTILPNNTLLTFLSFGFYMILIINLSVFIKIHLSSILKLIKFHLFINTFFNKSHLIPNQEPPRVLVPSSDIS